MVRSSITIPVARDTARVERFVTYVRRLDNVALYVRLDVDLPETKNWVFLLDSILADTMIVSLYKLFEQVFEICGYANSE